MEVFSVVTIKRRYTVSEQIANAILWIETLKKTQAKQQTHYLGSRVSGYSVLGLGCKVTDLPYYPDQKTSEDLMEALGLYNVKGAFKKALRCNGVYYKSVYHMGIDLTFRRVGSFLEKAETIKATFRPDVAEGLYKHFVKKGVKNPVIKD